MTRRFLGAAASFATLCLLSPGAASSQTTCGEPLTLRVSDTVAAPGGLAAVVLRTYASRPVGQGQIDLRAGFGFGALAAEATAMALEGVAVFSSEGDVTILDEGWDGDTASVVFFSPTGSVNDQDGPLAVFWFRLADDAVPGQYPLELQAPTFLDGPDGEPIQIAVRNGDLTVRVPDSPLLLEAEGDSVVGGQLAELGVETSEAFPIAKGKVALEWDSAIGAGPAGDVRIDPRYGAATWQVEESIPGRLVVSFVSADESLNSLVPGSFLQFSLRIASDASGAPVPITLDPTVTSLEGPGGLDLTLTLVDDEIELDGGRGLFHDGFECGATGAWSDTTP